MKFLHNKLDNGVSTIIVGFRVGSNFEFVNQRGISHFLEHILFKGSKNFPLAKDVSLAFESLGANQNAMTGYEFTGYHATCSLENLYKVSEILFEMVKNPLVKEEAVNAERSVIFEEIDMYKDYPDVVLSDKVATTLYGDQYGDNILGTKEYLKEITNKELKEYYESRYRNEEMIVVLVSPELIKEEIEKLVGREFSNFQINLPKVDIVEYKEDQTDMVVVNKPNKQCQLKMSMCFKTIPDSHEDLFPIDLLSVVIGKGMASKMFLKIREELSAAYSTRCYHNTFSNRGYLDMLSSIDKNKFKDVVEACCGIVNECKVGQISDTEIQRAKNVMIGSILRSVQTSNSIAYRTFTEYVKLGKVNSIKFIVDSIKEVSKDDLVRTANEYLIKDYLNLVYTHPTDYKTEFDVKDTLNNKL